MLGRQCLKRSFSSKVIVDEQCLPLKPVWSIKSLLDPIGKPISDQQFQHLLTLSRLCLPNKQKEKLKLEIDRLTQFTEHIKTVKFDKEIKPLTHIWQEETGQVLRDDKKVEKVEELRGRALLKYAEKKSGNFYVVKGSLPCSD